MAQQTINVGAAPNDGTGTPLRTAFQYTNSNFTELYTATGPSGNNINVPGAATITGNLTVRTTGLVVNASGLGVGVSPSAWNSNYNAIDIGENGSIAGRLGASNTVDTTSNAFRNSAGDWVYKIATSNLAARYQIDGSTGSHFWFNAPTGTAGNIIGWSTLMTLNSTGLGVGGSPLVKLSVVDTVNTFAATFRGNIGTDIVAIGTTALGASINAFTAGFGAATNLVLQPNGGNVGIGVTPSGTIYSSSETRFVVKGTAANYVGTVAVQSNGTTNAVTGFLTAGDGVNEVAIGSTTNTPITFFTNNVRKVTIDTSGNLILQSSATPATLTTNGQLTVNATSNTNLRFSYRGSDGVTRVADITLA